MDSPGRSSQKLEINGGSYKIRKWSVRVTAGDVSSRIVHKQLSPRRVMKERKTKAVVSSTWI